jgi:hypothetical protein
MNENKILNIIGASLILIFISGLIANIMVLRVFLKHKKLRKPVNFFTITLTIINMPTIFFHLPFLITGVYLKRFSTVLFSFD